MYPAVMAQPEEKSIGISNGASAEKDIKTSVA